MTVNAILQARMSSTRLPGKVLKTILGKPMLVHQIERIQRAELVDEIIVATSDTPSDDAIALLCKSLNIKCFRGSLHDVLARYYQASLSAPSEHIVRVTGDCPVIDPKIMDDVISLHLKSHADYTSNCSNPTYPDGLDTEVFTFTALENAYKNAVSSEEREHVTPYIYAVKTKNKCEELHHAPNLSHLRWTVDQPEDFALIEIIYTKLYPKNPTFNCSDILALIKYHPELTQMNNHYVVDYQTANENRIKHLKITKKYTQSNKLLKRAELTIPLGSQTFSKSKLVYPLGVSPLFMKKGKGCQVWDADDNQYTDFVNGLLSISLGYCDPDVDKAVQKQLKNGVTFSLPHQLEMEVAEQLVKLIPCADMVRFGKNGSDATSAAIRLARAYTNKEQIAVCGYHGWQDWYIGSTTRDLGVPKAVKQLTHKFSFNDIASLEKIFNENKSLIAAVILEPMNVYFPEENFLQKVKDLCKKENAVLIFDETITGFRFNIGGAQALFDVIPDLATFGKGMANGFPLSAITGKKEIMALMEDIFYSGTFGGETLSLAAASATIDKLVNQDVLAHIHSIGSDLIEGINKLIKKHHGESLFTVSGHPAWSFLLIGKMDKISEQELSSFIQQEMHERNLLVGGAHNISFSHKASDIQILLNAYDEIIPLCIKLNKEGNFKEFFHGEVTKPVFKVR